MPAYSFQERFVPMVLDGTKPHTIRNRRKKGFAKKGDTLYLYFGLRTKYCRKLREEKCSDVKTIIITEDEIYILPHRIADEEVESYYKMTWNDGKQLNKWKLNKQQRSKLAYNDGFRFEPTGVESISNFEIMIKWWRQTHELPFIGDIIYWQPK